MIDILNIDGKKYMVISTIEKGEETVCYLINKNDYLDLKFVEIKDGQYKEISDVQDKKELFNQIVKMSDPEFHL